MLSDKDKELLRQEIELANKELQLYRDSSLEEIIQKYTELRPKGAYLTGRCPLNCIKKGINFSVSPIRKIFYCFGCKLSGDKIKFQDYILNPPKLPYEELITKQDRYASYVNKFSKKLKKGKVKATELIRFESFE